MCVFATAISLQVVIIYISGGPPVYQLCIISLHEPHVTGGETGRVGGTERDGGEGGGGG